MDTCGKKVSHVDGALSPGRGIVDEAAEKIKFVDEVVALVDPQCHAPVLTRQIGQLVVAEV